MQKPCPIPLIVCSTLGCSISLEDAIQEPDLGDSILIPLEVLACDVHQYHWRPGTVELYTLCPDPPVPFHPLLVLLFRETPTWKAQPIISFSSMSMALTRALMATLLLDLPLSAFIKTEMRNSPLWVGPALPSVPSAFKHMFCDSCPPPMPNRMQPRLAWKSSGRSSLHIQSSGKMRRLSDSVQTCHRD